MIYLIFLLLTLDICILTVLNFCYREARWYIPAIFLFCNALTFLWWWMLYTLKDNNDLYIKTLIWDVLVTAPGIVLPILFFGVRLNNWTLFGVGLVVFGLLAIKLAPH